MVGVQIWHLAVKRGDATICPLLDRGRHSQLITDATIEFDMNLGLLIGGMGLLGLLLGGIALVTTFATGTAILRGGRRISRTRNAGLYWTNVAALCLLLMMSGVMIFLGSVPDLIH
jgi:hypothetical protein